MNTYLTANHVYFPVAQSSGKILELLRANKASGGDRTRKLFQFLNIIGGRALSRHLGRILEMAEDSADKWDYEVRIARRFSFAQQLELPIPLPEMKEAANWCGLSGRLLIGQLGLRGGHYQCHLIFTTFG